jgi:hypothetical protein
MQRNRTRYFVDKSVQGALLLKVTVLWLAFALTLAAVLTAIQFFENPVSSAAELFAVFPRRHFLTFLILLLLFPIFLWDTVRLSNRFAGPILRLRRMMRELAAGTDPGPLHFRDGDFWKELGDHFNALRAVVLEARDSSANAENDLPYQLVGVTKEHD